MTSTCKELEPLIAAALRKIDKEKENSICRYIPGVSGGYMHHFTLRKMKNQVPQELAEMIKKYIMNVEKPINVKAKPRAARGFRKEKGQIVLAESDLDHIIQMARTAGDKELIRRLLPRKDIKVIKRELLRSIRNDIVNHNLWNMYVEAHS